MEKNIFLNELKMLYSQLQVTPWPQLTLADYQQFFRTGERYTFERKYFLRRKFLLVYGLYALIYPESVDEQQLEFIINEICDEMTWALPAHLPIEPTDEATCRQAYEQIDLFAAETGQCLSELCCVYPKLSDSIKQRIYSEIQQRIFTPFEQRTWHWEQLQNNWSSVIASCIGMMVLDYPSQNMTYQQHYFERLRTIFEQYFKGFQADGVCVEGMGYWAYGFGYFNYFEEKYRAAFSKNFYSDKEKLRTIAAFAYRSELAEGVFFPFADAIEDEIPSGLLTYCQQVYQVKIPSVNKITSLENDHCYRWATNYRNWMWTQIYQCTKENKIEYFSETQWLAYCDDTWFIALKAGRNDESHNHNDVGNFAIGCDKTWMCLDIGAGEYTRDYFDNTKRYELLVNRSSGHSVAIINGYEQQYGAYAAKNVSYSESIEQEFIKLSMDLEEVYPIKSDLLTYSRTFTIEKNRSTFQVTDEMFFISPDNEITQVIMCKQPPKIKQDTLYWECQHYHLVLTWRRAVDQVKVESCDYKDHSGQQQTVFRVLLTTHCQQKHYQQNLVFQMKL